MIDGGHLFIVHGKLEAVVHDAAIVPMDQAFGSTRHFYPLVGDRPIQPERWDQEGWGRTFGATDRIWSVSIGGRTTDPYDRILERVHNCLRSIDRRRTKYEPVRGVPSRPLVAIPVIGIGFGGFSSKRGEVLHRLVAALDEAARTHDLDIALVTPHAQVCAAAQYARRGLMETLPEPFETAARILGQQAQRGELALFIGAGVSVAAGLHTWRGLVEHLEHEARMDRGATGHLTPIDRAELIEKVDKDHFQERIVSATSRAGRPSLLHVLLAGLDCREVVTTNYDVLYEIAVRSAGRSILSVMPWESAHGARRWVLKLHGDVEHPRQIVLTRRHMVLYDAANKPSASLLQSLLLTKTLLIVGSSMTDDNVIRLVHEVEHYRAQNQGVGTGPVGTVLDFEGDEWRRQLWEGALDWLMMPAMGTDGGRSIELFLDRLGFHATRDSTWLPDERFEDLIADPDERRLAQEVRMLYGRMPHREGDKWWPLVQRLKELGVDGD